MSWSAALLVGGLARHAAGGNASCRTGPEGAGKQASSRSRGGCKVGGGKQAACRRGGSSHIEAEAACMGASSSEMI